MENHPAGKQSSYCSAAGSGEGGGQTEGAGNPVTKRPGAGTADNRLGWNRKERGAASAEQSGGAGLRRAVLQRTSAGPG